MKRVIATVSGVLLLAGCGYPSPEEVQENRISKIKLNNELALRCAEGGGRYEWSGWNGYRCEYGEETQ